MERVSGVNNWKLVIRRKAAGVAILWAATCDAKAALPDTLFGLPVTALGDHALTPGRPMPEGEEVLVTCGPVSGEDWDNSILTDLTLVVDHCIRSDAENLVINLLAILAQAVG